MSWDNISNILILIFTFVGTCGTGFLVWKACQKPKAILRFEDEKEELTFSPHYFQSISTKYYVGPINDGYDASAYQKLIAKYNQKLTEENQFILSFCLSNTGELQLENYRVDFEWNSGIKSIGRVNQKPRKVIGSFIEPEPIDSLSFNKGKPQITYEPLDKRPLNQKDSKTFAFRFTPYPDTEQIELVWRISAKDFYKEGKLFVYLNPKVDELNEIHFINCERDVPEGGELIEDLMPYIQEMQKLVFDENTK